MGKRWLDEVLAERFGHDLELVVMGVTRSSLSVTQQMGPAALSLAQRPLSVLTIMQCTPCAQVLFGGGANENMCITQAGLL